MQEDLENMSIDQLCNEINKITLTSKDVEKRVVPQTVAIKVLETAGEDEFERDLASPTELYGLTPQPTYDESN